MSIGKRRPVLRIDHQPDNPFGAAGADGTVAGGVDTGAPPVPPTIPTPSLTSLSASLLQSAVTPSAQILAAWTSLETNDSETYRVQVATDSGFTALVGTWSTGQNQATAVLAPLKTSTLYYVRVQTIVGNTNSDWSAALSVTTPADTTAPSPVSGLSASFINAGDLQISWTKSPSANLRDTEVAIYSDNTKTTQYGLFYLAAESLLWTAAQNLAATSQLGDASVFVELRARSWGGVFSTAVSASATKSRPATPANLTTSWAGDTGAAGADCIISWDAATDADHYVVSIDGVSRTVLAPRVVYTLDQNRAEHSGTPDPVLSIIVAAYDGIGQANASSATATATNAAPAAPTVALVGGFSILLGRVSSATPADFDTFEYVWKLGGITQRTQLSKAAMQDFEVTTDGPGSWTLEVRVRDAFGQYSTATASSSVVMDALTLDTLREDCTYTDDLGSTSTALDALKDGTLGSGGITYSG